MTLLQRFNFYIAIIASGLIASVLLCGKITAANSYKKTAHFARFDKDELAKDVTLQAKVEADHQAKPVLEILKDLSIQSKVRLTTSEFIGSQRITIAGPPQKIYEVMQSIAYTLSHSLTEEQSYYWEKDKAGGFSAFVLKRNLQGIRQEREAREAPKRKIKQLLTDFRNILNLPPNERAAYKTDLPQNVLSEKEPVFGVYYVAIRGLSNANIDALVNGESVKLDPEHLRGAVSVSNQQEQTQYEAMIARITVKRTLPSPPKPLEIKETPTLRLTANTYSDNQPWRQFEYAIRLDGVLEEEWMTINPLERPVFLNEREEDRKRIVDLSPLLTAKGVTLAQRSSLAYTLQAFSKATGTNVCEEHFYKLNSLGVPITGLKPDEMKGTKTQLIAKICDNWGYTGTEKDGAYLLWSQSWVFDKATDISEYNAERWRKIRRKRERFTSQDLIGIAQSFTWSQVAVTLPFVLSDNNALPENEEFPPSLLLPIYSRTLYQALRLQGTLSPAERDQALTEEGIRVGSLSPEAITNVIRFVLIDHEEEQMEKQTFLRQAAIGGWLRLKRAEGYRYERPLIVEVRKDKE